MGFEGMKLQAVDRDLDFFEVVDEPRPKSSQAVLIQSDDFSGDGHIALVIGFGVYVVHAVILKFGESFAISNF
jgi:hypothetical protein